MKEIDNCNLKDLINYAKAVRVLYVEDEELLARTNIHLFEDIFQGVTYCKNGEEAYNKYKEAFANNDIYDLIITDINMPVMDGLELSKHILNMNSKQHIIALSAYYDGPRLEQIINIGISSFLNKPIKFDKLFESLRRTLYSINMMKEDRNNLEELLEENKNASNKDIQTGLKNLNALYEDLKSSSTNNLLLIYISNFYRLETVYGEVRLSTLLEIFLEKINLAVDIKSTFYRKSANHFVCLVDEKNSLEKIVQDIQDVFLGSEFTLSIGASDKKEFLLTTARMSLDFAIEHGLYYKLYCEEIDITDQYKEQMLFQSIIDEAIDEQMVFPVFQPIYDKHENILKYEVLMRISRIVNGKKKIYYPSQFMDISILSNRFIELSIIVIQKAFATMQHSPKQFSLNLSYTDIENNILLDEIEKNIQLYPSSGKRLVLEILETKDILSYEQMNSFIRRFREYGVKIAIDDFGAGYSNLNHIINLESDYVKLDGVLIKNLEHDKKSLAIVKSVVAFTKELGIKTIAEYVATKEIFEIVKGLGINEFQGFYLSKPKEHIDE